MRLASERRQNEEMGSRTPHGGLQGRVQNENGCMLHGGLNETDMNEYGLTVSAVIA